MRSLKRYIMVALEVAEADSLGGAAPAPAPLGRMPAAAACSSQGPRTAVKAGEARAVVGEPLPPPPLPLPLAASLAEEEVGDMGEAGLEGAGAAAALSTGAVS